MAYREQNGLVLYTTDKPSFITQFFSNIISLLPVSFKLARKRLGGHWELWEEKEGADLFSQKRWHKVPECLHIKNMRNALDLMEKDKSTSWNLDYSTHKIKLYPHRPSGRAHTHICCEDWE